jgi:HAD superfamily hydrolase (TIGR01509 family)
MAYKAVIFDMDGVIVDSEPLAAAHTNQFLLSLGVKDPSLFTGNIKGRNSHDVWSLYIETFNLPHDLQELKTRSRQSYLDYLAALPELPEIPGAIEFIKYCHGKHYKLAIASGASLERITIFLERLSIREYFDVVVNGDDIQQSKPAPEIFLLAAERLSVKPADCVVVEDAENGVRAAKAAGMKCIAYFGSDHNTDDLLAADLVVNDFHALVGGLKTGSLPV